MSKSHRSLGFSCLATSFTSWSTWSDDSAAAMKQILMMPYEDPLGIVTRASLEKELV